MKLAHLTVLAFLGALAFSVIFIADRETEASMERLSEYRIAHDSVIDADPNLKRVSMNSPYMRDER
jgi:hypothetical protein